MASYIIQIGPSEPRGRMLVGIVVADTVDQLFRMVNETEIGIAGSPFSRHNRFHD